MKTKQPTLHQNKIAVDVAFCCDKRMLPGLHVTVASLLRNFDPVRSLNIFWLHDGVSDQDVLELNETISKHKIDVSLQAILHNVDHRKRFSSLHGSFFPYARLDLARIVRSNKLLYLDSDLIIDTDLSFLFDSDLEENILGVPWQGGVVKQALDAELLIGKLAVPANTPYFNSGVLLIDLARWRENEIDEKVDALLESYGSDCISHDQSILNILFGASFAKLPIHYNLEVYAHDKPMQDIAGCVAHLTGLPKPWDPFGSLNAYSRIWNREFSTTACTQKKRVNGHFDWSRFATILPSLARLLYRKISLKRSSC